MQRPFIGLILLVLIIRNVITLSNVHTHVHTLNNYNLNRCEVADKKGSILKICIVYNRYEGVRVWKFCGHVSASDILNSITPSELNVICASISHSSICKISLALCGSNKCQSISYMCKKAHIFSFQFRA